MMLYKVSTLAKNPSIDLNPLLFAGCPGGKILNSREKGSPCFTS